MENANTVLNTARELNRLLVSSAEYAEYRAARAALRENGEHGETVEKFGKRQIEHEIRKINGEAGEHDELALSNDYADLCLIAECNDFFQAEFKFLALLKEAYAAVSDGIVIGVEAHEK